MRIFLTIFLLSTISQLSFGQDTKLTDTTSATFDVEIAKVASDPYYLLIIENAENIELAKSDVSVIEKKWISAINVWTDDEKKKEYGYEGGQTLVLITLKKKRVEDYLELIGK